MPKVQFSGLADFFNMGGYAEYVWAAYAIFAVFVAVTLIQPRLARRRLIRQLRTRFAREEHR